VPWSKRLIADERQLVTLIASPPGGGNRPHWHRDFDEWWVVLGGVLEWELTGGTVFRANKDDIDALLQPVRAVRLHRRRPARVVRLML
jgi:mannose-6-phosphate isomerase-like protein (cupin superfamily)